MESPNKIKRYHVNTRKLDKYFQSNHMIVGNPGHAFESLDHHGLRLMSNDQAEAINELGTESWARIQAVTILTVRHPVMGVLYVEGRRQKRSKADTLRRESVVNQGMRRIAHGSFPWHPGLGLHKPQEALATEIELAVKPKAGNPIPMERHCARKQATVAGLLFRGRFYVVTLAEIELQDGEDLVSMNPEWAIALRPHWQVLSEDEGAISHLTTAIFRKFDL